MVQNDETVSFIAALQQAKRNGLFNSWAELARETGYSKGLISQVINGQKEATPQLIRRSCEYIGMDMAKLTEGPNKEVNDSKRINKGLLFESQIKRLKAALAEKDKQIATQEALLKERERRIRDKEEIISLLKQTIST